MKKWAALGLVAGTLGVLMVLDVDFHNLSLFTAGYRLGDLLIICGIFVEGFYTIIGKRVLEDIDPLIATSLACAFGWLMLSFNCAPEIYELVKSPPSFWAFIACAYLGLVATALGYFIWFKILARRQSHLVGITIMIQPVVGIPLAALVFDEGIKPIFLLGALLIAAGVYLALGRDSGEDAGSRSASFLG